MKRLLALFSGLIVVLLMPAALQAQGPPPVWPPDPADIFAEGVSWTVYEEEPDPIPPVSADNDTHVIRVYNTADDTWTTYPYPDNVSLAYDARLLPDGMIRLRLNREPWERPFPGDVILLNPDTGVYSEPPTVCEGNVLQVPAEAGEWMIPPYDWDDETPVICHSHTGELLSILPEGFYDWGVFPSPDDTQLVLIGKEYVENGRQFRVWAYTLESGQRIELGILGNGYLDGWASVCDWFSDTQGLLSTGDSFRDWPGGSYYAFDVTQPDSVTRIARGWYGRTLEVTDLPRLVALYSYEYAVAMFGSRPPEHYPCTLTVHDTRWSATHEVGYECLPIVTDFLLQQLYYKQGSTIYFLTIDEENAAESNLYILDTNNPVPNFGRIFTAEIESILSVSPDGRYVVLLLGTDGVIDIRRIMATGERSDVQLLVLDVQHMDFVYLADTFAPYFEGAVTWLDDRTVVINTRGGRTRLQVDDDYIPVWIPPTVRRITFGEEGGYQAATISLDDTSPRAWLDVMSHSPNERYWLLRDQRLFDVMTFETLPVLRDGVANIYTIYMHWNDDDTLRVTVSMPDDRRQRVVYDVTW